MKNVIVGATSERLILEYLTIGLRTRDVQSIPYGSLKAVEARKGDSTIPGWAKINLQLAAMSAFTTSLVIEKAGEPPFHILFRPMPGVGDNRAAAIEIGRIISESRPEIATEVTYSSVGEGGKRAGCVRALRWGVTGGIVFAIPLGFFLGDAAGFAAGFFTGALVVGLLSFFWPMLTRGFTGRG